MDEQIEFDDTLFDEVDETSANSMTEGVQTGTPTDIPIDNNTEVPVETPIQDTPQTPTGMVNIPEVGAFSVDEIKAWRDGYAQQVKEVAKREIVGQPPQQALHPVEQRLVELEQKLADKELEDTLTGLKQKYPDFDETKVLQTAYERGLTDLEFVYQATRAEKSVDVEALKQQLRAELVAELTANKASTSTIIATNGAPVQASNVNLSPGELAIAEEFGLTPEEYLTYR